MTTLKINYYLLSYQLQQCFLFCSIFPNDYLFHIDDLVYMWISSGFVKSIEVGQDYLNALVNSGFLDSLSMLKQKTPFYTIKSTMLCVVLCMNLQDWFQVLSLQLWMV